MRDMYQYMEIITYIWHLFCKRINRTFKDKIKQQNNSGGTNITNNNIDETDMKIICHFCQGFKSYQDIADELDVSRNTVYRRVNRLREENVLREEVHALPDLSELGLTTIIIGLSLNMNNLEKAIDLFNKESNVKAIWETYGKHDLISIIISEKEKVGENIRNIKKKFQESEVKVKDFDVSTAISCEKLDLNISK